jgi:hypothetical protein
MIKRKILPCTSCKSNKPVLIVYSKGVKGANPVHLCCRCNDLRKNIKVRPIKHTKKPTGEFVLFETIWKTRKRVSFLSGKPLHEFSLALFAHVLPKGKYSAFRLLDRNIVLLTVEEHFLLDQGTEAKREKYAKENNCDWGKLYTLKQQLKDEYNTQTAIFGKRT